ncbi:MAG: T9SS type A sorting domain-containing protein [Bacteroidales bacterium]|nr:T9SS type A sorting domain-containing protein [Bacteroidales bacterium]
MKTFTKINKLMLLMFLLSSLAFGQYNNKTVSAKQYVKDHYSAMQNRAYDLAVKSESDLAGLNQDRHIETLKGAKIWNLEFQYDVETPSGKGDCVGAETDGSYIYVSLYKSDTILKFDMAGNFVTYIAIPGVANVRDMAYDGQYFYGSDASNYIWQMDFDNQQLVSTIPSPAPVRSIAYDSVNDAFWINNWSEDLRLITKAGASINTIAAPPSMYGSAYDGKTPGGPFLWIFTGTSSSSGVCQVEKYHLPSGQLTGIPHSISNDLGTGIAGGLFMFDDTATSKTLLCGLLQGTPVDICFGYDLLSTAADTNDVGVISMLSPVSGPNLTSSENVEVEIQNFGSLPQSGFDVTYIFNGGPPVTETVNGNINPFNTYLYTFATPVDLSNLGTYTFTVYTSLLGDNNLSNDTLNTAIAHIAPVNLDAYCYVANGAIEGPSKFNMQFPGIITNISDQSTMVPVYCGTWGAGNRWFGLLYEPIKQFLTFDTITGARSIISISNPVTTDENWTGLSYDYSTNTMYAMSYSAATESVLYTIDVWTGAPTMIGSTSGLMINLACNLAGDLYSVGIGDDQLYSIDKMTGVGTAIGYIGFDANFAQDMEFDRAGDRLFMAAYDATNGGQLRIVDVNTGMSINLGEFDSGAEVTGLAIPYYTSIGIHEIEKEFSYNVYPNPAYDHFIVNCTHNISEYTIINYIGQVVLQNVVNSDNFNVDVRSLSTGMYFIQLNTENGVVTEKISVE